jgi:hypothetical protein
MLPCLLVSRNPTTSHQQADNWRRGKREARQRKWQVQLLLPREQFQRDTTRLSCLNTSQRHGQSWLSAELGESSPRRWKRGMPGCTRFAKAQVREFLLTAYANYKTKRYSLVRGKGGRWKSVTSPGHCLVDAAKSRRPSLTTQGSRDNPVGRGSIEAAPSHRIWPPNRPRGSAD